MTREEVIIKLNVVFRDVFDDETLSVNDTTAAADAEGWDSLMHITLISVVEDAFGIRFEMKTAAELKNVGEMADRILELLQKNTIRSHSNGVFSE